MRVLQPRPPSARRARSVDFLLATLIVLGAALFGEATYRILNITHVALLYAGAVMVTALWLGRGMSSYAAVLAYLAYDFFAVEPRYKLQVATLDDLAVLAEFGAIALLAGLFANGVRREAAKSRLQAERTGDLFNASRDLANAEDEDAIRRIIARHVSLSTGADCIIADGGRLWPSRPELFPDAALTRALLPTGAQGGTPVAAGWEIAPLAAKDGAFGHVAWRPPAGRTDDVDAARQVIAILLAVGVSAVERARLSMQRTEVETLVRTERLRDALLSSISHDFRTPLTAILAAVTSMLHYGERFSASVTKDLLTTIREEAERLNRIVANLLSMTRLESGVLSFQPQTFDVTNVLGLVIGRLDRSGGEIELFGAMSPLYLDGDPVLFEQAMSNIVENAVRYSPQGSVARIVVRDDGESLIVRVEDEGPGVAPEERERIFDKFYRSPHVQPTVQGVGLGLSIARGLIECMGGVVSARGRDDGGNGLVVEARFLRCAGGADG